MEILRKTDKRNKDMVKKMMVILIIMEKEMFTVLI